MLAELSALVAEEASALNQVVAVLRTLDLALARGRYGRWLGGVEPQLEPAAEAPFRFSGLRHPLLVWQHKRADGPPVVPISVEVSPELRVVAITGPNTRWQDGHAEKHRSRCADGTGWHAPALFGTTLLALVCPGAGRYRR